VDAAGYVDKFSHDVLVRVDQIQASVRRSRRMYSKADRAHHSTYLAKFDFTNLPVYRNVSWSISLLRLGACL
jgi:hypothetical protein